MFDFFSPFGLLIWMDIEVVGCVSVSYGKAFYWGYDTKAHEDTEYSNDCAIAEIFSHYLR